MGLILGAAMSFLIASDKSETEVAHIGALKLCRAIVLDASVTPDRYPERFVAMIRLRGSATIALARATEVTGGNPISITLNGEVVMEPRVMEPILNGELELVGPDEKVLQRIVRAALNGC